MSLGVVLKQVDARICDYCEQEINQEDFKNWAQLTKQYISKPAAHGIKRFLFWWDMPDKRLVTWDFHAACLYKILGKAMKEQHSEQ